MSLKYGLIGCGMIAQEHLENIKIIGDIDVIALADPVEEMSRTACDILPNNPSVFTDYREMLSNVSCDAFIIATPNHTHHEVLKDVLLTNTPVLVEKPLCINLKQCRDILDLQARLGVPVWVAMEYRFMPPVARLVEMCNQNLIGNPVMASIREHRFPFLPKVGDWNRFNRNTGGTMVEKCCHYWDLLRLFFKSNPTRVYCSSGMDVNHLDETYDGQSPDIHDNSFTIVEFENNCRGMLDLCMFSDAVPWQEEISITGPKGRVDAFVPASWQFKKDSANQTSLVQHSNRATAEVVKEEISLSDDVLKAGSHYGATFYQQEQFAKMIHSGGTKPEVTLSDGYWAVAVGESAERSILSGQAESIDPI